MSNKVKRKVTVDNSKDGDDQPRRPSVFERLGPNAVNVAAPPTDRHSRPEQGEKCRNWFRTGACVYGNNCRYKHEPLPASSRRATTKEKDMEEKDLRHRVKTKRDEPKGSRTGSLSPKRIGKRSNSRSRKGEHESKIKSTVVVTRPRSPTSAAPEPVETKKKGEGNWEDDSDDWPMDAAQLDFKEELTLERKRQQLQRELALELQKERLLNENVTITKTVSFSESSSSSSSSDSGSISSSSGSSSSSSEDDSDSSSSSSSSSSSGSRQPVKNKNKKASKDTSIVKPFDPKGKDDYDKLKSRSSKPHKTRSPSPAIEGKTGRKVKDKRKSSLSPRKRQADGKSGGDVRNVRVRGPRTPSPIASRKQRQWGQSSSTDSRSADAQKNKGKRHKKKKDGPRGDKFKSGRMMSPPPLSSPNRTALQPMSSKKSKRDRSKSHRRGREPSPMMLPRNTGSNQPSVKLIGDARDRHHSRERKHSKKENKIQGNKRHDSQERMGKRNRDVFSKDPPKRDIHKQSLSPDVMSSSKKLYSSVDHKDKGDRRHVSGSPILGDRRKFMNEPVDKKRDIRDVSPRGTDLRRDAYRGNDLQYDKKIEKGKRTLSPDIKKGRDDRIRDRGVDYESTSWAGDHRKPVLSTGRRTPEPRGRLDIRGQPPILPVDRSRDRVPDRKKRKDRDLSVESERTRLPSPRRSQSPLHGHYAVREIEPLTGNRGRIFDPEIPPGEREYAYGYDPLHDPYDRLIPSDYEADVIRDAALHPEVYPESRYRRDIKDSVDRYGQREVLSPREILPHRDIISLTARGDDYLSDLPIEERSYDERWPRGRARDDWDPLPPAPLPPHVAAALNEDRYGMPRRRRASPEWTRNRMDDREPGGGHRPLPRGQLPRDGRSRSPPPPKGPASNRPGWNDRSGRHDKSDSRLDDQQKIVDDRKGKPNRKDRGDRIKRNDVSSDIKKEKSGKRPHSPSPPPKDNKRRREDTGTPDIVLSDKGSHKKLKDDVKIESKSLSRVQKSSKLDTSSPRSDGSHGSIVHEKGEKSKFAEGRSREDRKTRHNAAGEDEFSDWSDGDDDLLIRDDPIDSVGVNENVVSKHKTEEKSVDTGPKRKEKVLKDPQINKLKDGAKRPTSRDRNLALLDQCFSNFTQKKNAKNRTKSANMEKTKKDSKYSENKTGPLNSERVSKSTDDSHAKENKLPSRGKDTEAPDNSSLKDDAATDVDEYITAESVDYDPISDDELDALIEEPEEPVVKHNEAEKSKIVDALDVNWQALMSDTKTDFKPGFARKRFTAAHVLSRIGFSQVFAGSELTEKVINICQEQLNEEKVKNADNSEESSSKDTKKFVMEHPIAAFHVSVAQTKKERSTLFNKVGNFRRALCARRDLQIRNFLCKPLNKFAISTSASYSPQYSVVDKDLYKQSVELLRQKSPAENKQPQTVDVC